MDFENLNESLELQISELEMLNSMYPREEEFKLTDPSVVSEIQDYLSGNVDIDDVQKLEYIIHLDIQAAKVEVGVSLPHGYPFQRPQISVHSGAINRSGHESLCRSLDLFLDTLETGTLCINLVIEWVLEKFPLYLYNVSQSVSDLRSAKEQTCSRLWILSHHIYSKNKIKSIQDWARELVLTGFILPGKPGIICVEGLSENCQIWWQRVRGMNWHKISCKLEENGDTDLSWRKFQDFLDITNIKDSQTSSMKAFVSYLEQHNSSHVFKEYFGFDGK